ncbi:hypothetical protein EJ06DRAFT_553937 [Trichodelitschia bisporula]|uniref:Uncharacterized protein n=1 Tax=Trichodelitschia bisporula TaxID=703511 RepID=A0A6G1I6R6_9PEZI|nr:hypothetical protein EJ06DRAFT_553937 [Trichodelitschia bisporula]
MSGSPTSAAPGLNPYKPAQHTIKLGESITNKNRRLFSYTIQAELCNNGIDGVLSPPLPITSPLSSQLRRSRIASSAFRASSDFRAAFALRSSFAVRSACSVTRAPPFTIPSDILSPGDQAAALDSGLIRITIFICSSVGVLGEEREGAPLQSLAKATAEMKKAPDEADEKTQKLMEAEPDIASKKTHVLALHLLARNIRHHRGSRQKREARAEAAHIARKATGTARSTTASTTRVTQSWFKPMMIGAYMGSNESLDSVNVEAVTGMGVLHGHRAHTQSRSASPADWLESPPKTLAANQQPPLSPSRVYH